MYLMPDGWVAEDSSCPPHGAVKACHRRNVGGGPFWGAVPAPVWEEVLDDGRVAELEERFGSRPEGW